MRFAKSMAAEDNMDVTPPSPEIGDSRKRPLDDSSDNGSTKRSHFSGESKHFRKKKAKKQKKNQIPDCWCVLSLSFIITYFEFVPRKWEMRKWEIRDIVARKRFSMELSEDVRRSYMIFLGDLLIVVWIRNLSFQWAFNELSVTYKSNSNFQNFILNYYLNR